MDHGHLARHFDIEKSTVYKIEGQRDKVMMRYALVQNSRRDKGKRVRLGKFPEMENALHLWIKGESDDSIQFQSSADGWVDGWMDESESERESRLAALEQTVCAGA